MHSGKSELVLVVMLGATLGMVTCHAMLSGTLLEGAINVPDIPPLPRNIAEIGCGYLQNNFLKQKKSAISFQYNV